MGAIFRMIKIAEAAKVAKVARAEKCELDVSDLFWQGWTTHFDNTNWEIDPDEYGSEFWDGEKWDSGIYGTIFLQVIGTWAKDYRPTRCRVSVLTSGTTNIYIYCAVGGGHGSYLGITGDGTYEFPISIRENNCDIHELKLWGPIANFYVTNIEFFPGEFNIKPDITEYIEEVV
jgi:hypothetical protein